MKSSHARPATQRQSTTARAFTLIELLIVVAIIAILAAIAVPNFLEAQVRSKASRAKADLRTIATGLEAYVVDHNHYPPNDGGYNVTPRQLSTPTAYLTSVALRDPFMTHEVTPVPGLDPELAKFYTYTKPVTAGEHQAIMAAYGPTPPIEARDFGVFNRGAYARYGGWRILSDGPDRRYSGADQSPPEPHPAGPYNPHPSVLYGADIPYDPTNGTVSWGNILRTQAVSDGCRPAALSSSGG